MTATLTGKSHWAITWCGWLCLNATAVAGFPSDGPQNPSEERTREPQRIREFQRIAAELHLTRQEDAEQRLQLKKEPLLSWSNPTRPAPYGATFLWTRGSRPAAIGCIYEWINAEQTTLNREFHSLSESSLRADDANRRLWSPEQSGVQFRPLPDAPAPADRSAVRSAQMRLLARRFAARLVQLGKQRDFQLRLLPRPLYEYGKPDNKLEKGGLFAFVQGTDPEVILLIELRSAEPSSAVAWHYALARMTSGALKVEYDGKIIWTVQEIRPHRLPNSSRHYAVFFRNVPANEDTKR